MTTHETHRSHRVGWLRAAVLGANDGIVSTASLIIGVAAANTNHSNILLAGLAGLVAGAMSMAAGEYVSVSSQSDTEQADLEQERISLQQNIDFERNELAKIYEERGLTPDLAHQVAAQLMEHDALGAHARDEIGIIESTRARPIQAASLIGGDLYRWRSIAFDYCLADSTFTTYNHSCHTFARISCCFRQHSRTSGRCPDTQSIHTGDILGCFGNGFNRRCWPDIRRRGLIELKTSHCKPYH